MHVPSTDGVSVALHDLGGHGEPLVIAHATGFCGRTYEPLAAELAPRFHVWALDFRAHGDSTPPDGDRFDWHGMADDLEAALSAIVPSGEPVAVFGHSMGGGAAMLLEHRRPGTFRCAYLFEPIILPSEPEPESAGPRPDSMSEAAARRRPSFPSRGAVMLRYASRPPLGVLRADALLAYVTHGFRDEPDGSVTLKLAPAHEAATFAAPGKPTVDLLADVEVPTTVAIGSTAEEWMPAHFGAAVATALPHGRLEEHPVLGHFGPLQGPVTIGAAILAASAA